jgi:hypothetical protein
MTAQSGIRIDKCRLVVSTGLADVAIGNSPDLGAVPVSVGELGCAATQLTRGFCVRKGQESCREKEMHRDWMV